MPEFFQFAGPDFESPVIDLPFLKRAPLPVFVVLQPLPIFGAVL